MIYRSAGHHGGSRGHGVSQIVEFLDMWIVQFAKVIPNAGFRWNDIGLVASIDDHVVGTLLQTKMLTPEIPADVHEFDGIEGTAPSPRRSGGVGRAAVEGILHADEPAPFAVAGAVGGGKFRFDVGAQNDVHIFEIAGAYQKCFCSQQFLRDARENFQRSGDVVLFHQLLQDNGGGHLHGHAGVVPFSMAGRSLDDGRVVSDAGFLRSAMNAVNIGDERDHGFAAAEARNPRRGNAGNAALDRKSVFLEDGGDVARGLHFLKAQFAVAVDLVDHLLREGLTLVDFLNGLLLQIGERRCSLRHGISREHQSTCHNRASHAQFHPIPPDVRAGIILWFGPNAREFDRTRICVTIWVSTMPSASFRIALLVCLGLFLATLAPIASGQEIESVYGPLPVFEFHSSFWVNLHHFLYHEARARMAAKDAQATAAKPTGPVMKVSFGTHTTLTAAEQKIWDDAIAFYVQNEANKDMQINIDLILLKDQIGDFEDCDELTGRKKRTCDAGLPGRVGQVLE